MSDQKPFVPKARPAWATWLIVGVILFGAWLFSVITGSFGTGS